MPETMCAAYVPEWYGSSDGSSEMRPNLGSCMTKYPRVHAAHCLEYPARTLAMLMLGPKPVKPILSLGSLCLRKKTEKLFHPN